MYLTDDRDYPEDRQRALVIFEGGNGDWYVQVAPAHGRTTEGVRICTSGGAASNCPGLGAAIADAYRAMKAAQAGERPLTRPRFEMEEEIAAWRERFPEYKFSPQDGCVALA
jgi:hypothetical protein